MKILGIDPGLNITGYGLIEDKNNHFRLIEAGFIRTDSKVTIQQRLNKIYQGLSELIKTKKPDVMVLEKLYAHYRHPTTACLLGHVRGIICLLASQAKLDFFEYAATRIKKSIIGRGHASKYQIQKMVQDILKLKQSNISEDITDALALAIAHAYISKVRI